MSTTLFNRSIPRISTRTLNLSTSTLHLLPPPSSSRILPASSRFSSNELQKTDPSVSGQAPNRLVAWSKNQSPRSESMRGPRFEQTVMELQPFPQAAIDLIHKEPIRLVSGRVATCDGGGGALGHPRIFINLDKPGYHPCTYCGIRFERDEDHHH